MKHKYGVGETVYFTASNVARPAASGTYEVLKLLPTRLNIVLQTRAIA